MDIPGHAGTFPATMGLASPIAVAFREVRHFQPDDALHCETLDVRGAEFDWTIPAHRHEGLHQALWLESGSAQLQMDHRTQALSAPAVLMVAPGCVHALCYQPDCSGRQVTAPSVPLGRALSHTPLLAARLARSQVLQGEDLPAAEAARARHFFNALADEFEVSAPGRADALQAHVLLLFTWLLRQAESVPVEDVRRALRDTLVQRYRALLELHLRQHWPLAAYAEALHVTPDHLSRCCRAVLGQSALDLMQDRLLIEARRLLAYTPAAVAEVAGELGFDDPAYFSRFFARRAGLTPTAYRRALTSGTPGLP